MANGCVTYVWHGVVQVTRRFKKPWVGDSSNEGWKGGKKRRRRAASESGPPEKQYWAEEDGPNGDEW